MPTNRYDPTPGVAQLATLAWLIMLLGVAIGAILTLILVA